MIRIIQSARANFKNSFYGVSRKKKKKNSNIFKDKRKRMDKISKVLTCELISSRHKNFLFYEGPHVPCKLWNWVS